jgi:RNA-directed DNA polymerase
MADAGIVPEQTVVTIELGGKPYVVHQERYRHAFVRYADDCQCVRAVATGSERVMAALERMYAKLRLKVNRAKSKVELAHKRSILSYSFWYARGGAVACRVAPKALRALKQRVRLITRRNGGRSLRTIVADLKQYLPGWKEYFRLADTPKTFVEYDKWLRYRLRALQLKQWKRGSKIYAEMRRLGLSDAVAAQAAAVNQRWWARAASAVHAGLTARYYDRRE